MVSFSTFAVLIYGFYVSLSLIKLKLLIWTCWKMWCSFGTKTSLVAIMLWSRTVDIKSVFCAKCQLLLKPVTASFQFALVVSAYS